MPFLRKTVLLILIMGLFSGCVTTQIPNKEYVLAKAAYDAAIAAEAAKFAPQLYYKAEKSFKKAEALYKERYYEEAKKEFIYAKNLSEKAENAARMKQFNSNEEGNNE